jgi:hypothetical protein
MVGIFVQTTLYGRRDSEEIKNSGLITGRNLGAIGKQLPSFKDVPLTYCSYLCEGYRGIYGGREGITFETDSPVVYSCPADTFELMRSGDYLPGHERFVFPTVEAMLESYPSQEDFVKDFRKYFERLKPQEVYPRLTRMSAIDKHNCDYCLLSDWKPGYNEITFRKPLEVKKVRIFDSVKELKIFTPNP